MVKQEINEKTLSAVYSAIGYKFQQPELVLRALTHKSAREKNNERLEFLGDSVLGMIVSLELFSRFANANEGQLTRARSKIVRQDSLAESARRIGLGTFLYLGEGELRSGGWQRSSILADAVEALIGAVYIDGGFNSCHEMVTKLLTHSIEKANPDTIGKDAKTELQEYVQGKGIELPEYKVDEVTGPSHSQVFTVSCTVDALNKTEMAQGSSKRSAEQAAARKILKLLENGMQ